jgi:hypothetical protein
MTIQNKEDTMAEEKLGLKMLIANLILLKDVRHSFTKNPEQFLKDNPKFSITAEELKQLKTFKIEDWDAMKLNELNDWLLKASEISRPVGTAVSVGVP